MAMTADTRVRRPGAHVSALYSIKRLVFRAFYNRIVEAPVIFFIASALLIFHELDRIFHTRLRQWFISQCRYVSRDELSTFRKLELKHLFRKHYGLKKVRSRLAGGTYWLSLPCIVEGVDRRTGEEKKYMGKIMNGLSALKNHYINRLRNLGIMAEGANFRFDDYRDARDMAEYEMNFLSGLGGTMISAPKALGLHRLAGDDYILVMEYIEGVPLSEAYIGEKEASQVFATLKSMRDGGYVHGDVKLDNFLYADGRIYVIDCLRLNRNAVQEAADFDLVCAICSLSEKLPVKKVMEIAKRYFSPAEIESAAMLFQVALNKSDYDLDEASIATLRKEFHL